MGEEDLHNQQAEIAYSCFSTERDRLARMGERTVIIFAYKAWRSVS